MKYGPDGLIVVFQKSTDHAEVHVMIGWSTPAEMKIGEDDPDIGAWLDASRIPGEVNLEACYAVSVEAVGQAGQMVGLVVDCNDSRGSEHSFACLEDHGDNGAVTFIWNVDFILLRKSEPTAVQPPLPSWHSTGRGPSRQACA